MPLHSKKSDSGRASPLVQVSHPETAKLALLSDCLYTWPHFWKPPFCSPAIYCLYLNGSIPKFIFTFLQRTWLPSYTVRSVPISCEFQWMRWRRRVSQVIANLELSLPGTSLVLLWLRLCTPTQAAQVWSLFRELDPTCHNERPHMPQLTWRMQLTKNINK